MEIFRVNPNLNLDKIIEKLGVPQGNEFLFSNAIMTGLFLDASNDSILQEEIEELKTKIRNLLPTSNGTDPVDCEINVYNITKVYDLEQREKDAFVITFAFEDHVHLDKATEKFVDFEFNGFKLTFKQIDFPPENDEVIGFVPEDHKVLPIAAALPGKQIFFYKTS